MTFFESILPSGAGSRGLNVPGLDRVRDFARHGFSKSPTMTIPVGGGRRLTFATDRVRAVPAVTPTISGMLGMGAIGLGMWGMFAPKSVSRFLGIPAPAMVVRALFGARELYTGYSLAGDPTKSDVLWMRVAGDVFDLAVLRLAANPRNPKRGNANFMLGAVLAITALDVVAAVRMTNVQRNCVPGARR